MKKNIITLKNYFQKLKNTGFIHIVISGSATKVIGFATSILLVRVLSKEDYGVYTYAETILNFISIISCFGITSGFLQYGSETNDEKKRNNVYKFCCKFGLIYDLILGLLILCFAFIVPLEIKGANKLLAMMAFIPLFQFFFNIQGVKLRVEMKNKIYAISNAAFCALNLTIGIMLAYLYESIGLIISTYLVAIIICLIISVFFKMPIKFKNEAIDHEVKKDLLKISGISMLNNGFSALLYQIDIIIIGIIIVDENVLASYKVATTIPFSMSFISSMVVVYIYPYFAKNNSNSKWLFKNYKKVLLGVGLINFIIALNLFIFAPYIIEFLYGTEYIDSIPIFKLLAINLFFSGTFKILAGNLLVTQRKLKFNLVVAIFSGLLNIIANIIFIKNYGAIGAAISTVLIVFLTGSLNTIYLIITFNKIKVKNQIINE